MARKEDLELLLRDSYEIIAENQRIIQESPELPAQRKRAKRQIDQQWDLIQQYLTEYVPLSLAIQANIPTDIVQILARFPSFVSQITKIANGEKVLEVAASELLLQIKQAEANRSLFDESTDLRDYGYELAELRSLIDKYRSEINNLKFLRRDKPPTIINLRTYLTEVTKEFEEWGRKYTSLRLTHELRLTAWYGEVAQLKSKNRPKELSVREAFKRYSNLIVLGEPGSGKTTSLKRMALEYSKEAEIKLFTTTAAKSDYKIPVFVQLGGYTDRVALGLAQHRYEDILWLIGESLQATLGDAQPEIAVDDVRKTLAEYSFAFFLDGLNEVAEDKRTRCAEAIREFADLYDKHQYVITSRKHGYVPRLNYETLEILELSLEDISQYVARYLNKTKAQKLIDQLSPQLRRIAQNPLVLRIMIDVFQEKHQLPRSRGRLFERFVHLMLERDVAERSASLNYPKTEDVNLKIKLCIPIGYWMQTGGQYISEADALKLVEAELGQLNRNDILATKIVDDLCNSRLLERTSQGYLHFWHQTVQEYFAAAKISEEWRTYISNNNSLKSQTGKAIAQYIKEVSWHETFAIGAGLLDSEELHLLIRHLQKRNILLMSMCLGNSENILDGDEKAVVSELYKSLSVWKYLSPEPISVLYTSWPFLVFFLASTWGYSLIKHQAPLFYQFGHSSAGYQIYLTVFGINIFNFSIPSNFFIYQLLVSYWNLPPSILGATNRIFPWAITYSVIYLAWKGLNRLNEVIFAKRIYNRLTALRYIGTIHARDALAKLRLETQSNRWVHPQYKTAILAAQMVSADTEAELLSLLINKDSQMYAIEVLGDIATDRAVEHLYPMIDNSDDLIARGAVQALTKVADKREFQRGNVLEKLTIIINTKTKPFELRQAAYQGLKGLGFTGIKYPLPTWGDVKRWKKKYRTYYTVAFPALIILAIMIMTYWENDTKFFIESFDESNKKWETTENELGRTEYVEGRYDIFLKPYAPDFAIATFDHYQDVHLSVDVQVQEGGESGLMFRMQDWSNYYFVTVDADGFWTLFKKNNGVVVSLYRGYLANNSTYDGFRHISISVEGNTIRISLNKQRWVSVTDSSFTEGRIGLIVVHNNGNEGTVIGGFDNLHARNPHPLWLELPYWLIEQRESLVIWTEIILTIITLLFIFNNSIFAEKASRRDLIFSFISSSATYWLVIAYWNGFARELSFEFLGGATVAWGIGLITLAGLYRFRWTEIHPILASFFTVPLVCLPLITIALADGLGYNLIVLTFGLPILIYSLLYLKNSAYYDLSIYILCASIGTSLGGGMARIIGKASASLLPGTLGSMTDSFFEGLLIFGNAILISRLFEQIAISKMNQDSSSTLSIKEESKIPEFILKIFPSLNDESFLSVFFMGVAGAMLGGALGASLIYFGVFSNELDIGTANLGTPFLFGGSIGMSWLELLWPTWLVTRKSKIIFATMLLIIIGGGIPLLSGDVYHACEGVGVGLGLGLARFVVDLRRLKME